LKRAKNLLPYINKGEANRGWQKPQKKKEKAGKKNPPLKDTNTISL
jgi:hypothetical protein